MNDTLSTAVKAIRLYLLPNGAKVLDIFWADPGSPDIILLDRTVQPPVALDFIEIDETDIVIGTDKIEVVL